MPQRPFVYSMFPFPKAVSAYYKRLFLALLFVFRFGQQTSAQEMNLPAYDHTYLHFGFIIAYNSTNFFVQPISDLSGHFNDTLKSIYSQPQGGFNLGIVTELKIGPYLKLRFVPDLAFSTRVLAYNFAGVDTFTVTKKIQSTFLDFPIDVKLISKRLTNVQAYVLGGLKFITDLASQKGVDQNLAGANATVRIIRNDYAYEAGAGLQFFLPYFKFGIEFKVSMGVRDLLIRDNSVYTESLETLRSKVFLLSFNFEG